MLLSSVNSLDYALDVATNNKQSEIDIDIDKNQYKNLNQDDNIDEVQNSTAINFNEIPETNTSSNEIIKNENIYIPNKKRSNKIFSINNIFSFVTKTLKFIGPLFCITILTFLLYTLLKI